MPTLASVLLGATILALIVDLLLNVRVRLKYRHIPGPAAEGSAGHLRYLAFHNVFDVYREWRRIYGPVFLSYLGRQPVVVISDADLARQVGIKQFRVFHDRAIPPIMPMTGKRLRAMTGLVAATGSYWVSLRSALQPLFHTPRLQHFAGMMVAATDTLVAGLKSVAASGVAVDIHHALGRLTMEVVGISAFGLHLQLQEPSPSRECESELVRSVEALFATPLANIWAGIVLMLPLPLGQVVRWGLATFQTPHFRRTDLNRIMLFSTNSTLVENARRRAQKLGTAVAAPEEDWKWWSGPTRASQYFQNTMPMTEGAIDMLLASTNRETGAGFTDRQITSQCNVLLSAGYETTANALTFTIYQLARHPAAEDALLAEVDAFGRERVPTYDDLDSLPYTRAIVMEAMRLMPPVPTIPRIALEDTQVGDFYIPKGTWVYIAISNLHMDPAHWSEPEVYRPERFTDPTVVEARHPQAFMPFGVGPRLCIGWRFAVEEAQIALVRLYQKYTFRLPEGLACPPAMRLGVTCAFRDGLPVHVVSRPVS